MSTNLKFEDFVKSIEGTQLPAQGHSPVFSGERVSGVDNQNLQVMCGIAESLKRIADHLAPVPSELVGTPYVAERLGCTTVWVTEMIRNGQIPQRCVVPGTGDGKPWKFVRTRIDEWIKNR